MKTLSFRVIGVIFAWLAVCSTAQAASAVWGGLHPIPDAHSLEDVLRNTGPSTYIAVGEGGAILTSLDGMSWTVQTSDTVQKLYSVIWDGNRYIAVGEGGLVMTSPTGTTWTKRDTRQRKALFDIAYSQALSIYVAVGQEGTLLTSPDAVNWSEGDPNTGASRPLLQGITWDAAQNLFIAVGSSSFILTSPDGTTWTVQQRITFGQENILLEDVATNGSRIVAVGRALIADLDRSRILTSDDGGATWVERASGTALGITNLGLNSIALAGGQFVTVGIGDDGDPDDPADDVPAVILVSSNGLTWTSRTTTPTPTTRTLRGVAGDGTNFVAVGDQLIINSGDGGTSWTELTAPVTETLYDIAWNNADDEYVAVGDTGRIVTSPDGDNWTARNSMVSNTLRGIAWRVGSQYVAVGDGATILRSTDGGATWSAATGNPLVGGETLRDVTLAGSQYVAVGDTGTIITSADGDTWTAQPKITSSNLNGVAYSSGLYVAVGDDGVILTSSNATSWSAQTSGVTSILNAVAFVPGSLLVVGDGGTVLQNSGRDGIQWTLRNPGTSVMLHDVLSNGTQVLAVGAEGQIRRSEDGLRWTALLSNTGKELHALAWDNARFLAAGESGTILTSGGVDVSIDVTPPDSATVNNAKDSPGTVFTYTVSNIANLDATSVQFQMPVPAAFEFVDAVPPPQLNDPNACFTTIGAIVTCNLGTLVGGSSGLTVIVALNPRAEGIYTISATVSTGADNNPANDQISAAINVGPEVFNIPNPDAEVDTDAGFGALGGPMLALLALFLLVRRGVGDKVGIFWR